MPNVKCIENGTVVNGLDVRKVRKGETYQFTAATAEKAVNEGLCKYADKGGRILSTLGDKLEETLDESGTESQDGGENDAPKSVGDMSKAELIAHAEKNQIEIDASAKKADILAAITAAESGGENEGGDDA